jgi:hypothetical protein
VDQFERGEKVIGPMGWYSIFPCLPFYSQLQLMATLILNMTLIQKHQSYAPGLVNEPVLK